MADRYIWYGIGILCEAIIFSTGPPSTIDPLISCDVENVVTTIGVEHKHFSIFMSNARRLF
jgi:hypothetical protein